MARSPRVRLTEGGARFHHLAGELFRLLAKVELNHVPYRGGEPALSELLAGTVPILRELPHRHGGAQEGQVRLLGIGGRSRIPSQPNLTTIAEQGAGGHEIQSWSGLFTPRGTPQPVIERMAQEVKVPLNDPTTGERIAESGSWNIWADPQATDAFVRAEFDRWGPIVKQAGMTNG